MNLILGNLTQLKAFLLNESLRADTQWDSALAVLGKGVAERLQAHCNRLFARAVGATFECTADRAHVSLPRFPLEAVTAIELRETMATGWVDQGTVNTLVEQINLASGLVDFGSIVGPYSARLRLTYTGGYWVPDDDANEDDPDLPAGASLVPSALQLAWLLQCQHAWSLRDNLGLAAGQDKAGVSPDLLGLSRLELVPEVKESLRTFVRLNF